MIYGIAVLETEVSRLADQRYGPAVDINDRRRKNLHWISHILDESGLYDYDSYNRYCPVVVRYEDGTWTVANCFVLANTSWQYPMRMPPCEYVERLKKSLEPDLTVEPQWYQRWV